MNEPRTQLRAFLSHRRATLARLRRVNARLSRWEGLAAAAAMPEALRPPPVERPSLNRTALKELQRMLGEVPGELEEAWERRNYWFTADGLVRYSRAHAAALQLEHHSTTAWAIAVPQPTHRGTTAHEALIAAQDHWPLLQALQREAAAGLAE